ncbi:3'(2'),5'-bisphosphate nucleotidase CysQ [Xanthobacter sp. KR7-225]|uniref:3'(2'),5'-bisphosphate nucleotidase CysQ n=1 Tax=Xanthobacter sp. KR7-225 TaxID=3156613 RepID=UPI0032B5AF5D
MSAIPSATTCDTDALMRPLAEAVARAGALARDMRAVGVATWTKGNDSPVTEADMAVDRLLHDALMGAAPDVAWLSEESADTGERLAAGRLWVVDPIDGTRAFMAGGADWAISAALVEDGRPVAAALYAPASEEMFLAARGRGATLNGAPIEASRRQAIAGARVAGPPAELDAFRPKVALSRMPRVRSLALRLARVASGELDLALVGVNAHDWDLAAADLIVEEARGRLTGYGGAPLRYNRRVPRHAALFCAGLPLHAAVLAARGPVPLSPPSQADMP